MKICDHCGGPATHEGYAFPAGGSFPVRGCMGCLGDLDADLGGNAVVVRPITDEELTQ